MRRDHDLTPERFGPTDEQLLQDREDGNPLTRQRWGPRLWRRNDDNRADDRADERRDHRLEVDDE